MILNKILEWFSSRNNVVQHRDDGDDQKDMNQIASANSGDNPEKTQSPNDNADNGYKPKNTSHDWLFKWLLFING